MLFGGGLAMGDAMFTTGLVKWMGEGLAAMMHAHTTLGLIIIFTVIGTLLTETTSNTATANMIVPVAIAVSQPAGVSPLRLVRPAEEATKASRHFQATWRRFHPLAN